PYQIPSDLDVSFLDPITNKLIQRINQHIGSRLIFFTDYQPSLFTDFHYINNFSDCDVNAFEDSLYNHVKGYVVKLGLPEKRAAQLTFLVKLLSSAMTLPQSIYELILLYSTIIVYVQDFPRELKFTQSYLEQCNSIVDFLLGNESLAGLKEHKYSDHPSKNLLTKSLIEQLIKLTSLLESLQQEGVIMEDFPKLFYLEFIKSIRTCHLPSIQERSTLNGYLVDASSSCMAKPVVTLIISTSGLTLAHMKEWEYRIELVHLCMRLVNDFFSYEKEKSSHSDYLRNVITIIQAEGANEYEARLIVVQLYNLLMGHYVMEKDKHIRKSEECIALALELMNDIPLFFWSELASR
ncbi:MAG: terpene synthase family protein, partial [Cyanobacteria bacterium J06635_15]